MPKEIIVKAIVEIPRVPNFLRTSPEGAAFPLRACTDEDLRVIGAAWTEGLIKRAKEQREQNKDDIQPST